MKTHLPDQAARKPPIRSLGGTAPVTFARGTLDIARRAALYGAQVAVMPHDPAGLLRLLHYKLHQSARIRQRAGWPLGGLLNWAFGEGEADYIHCAGAHLVQILGALHVDPPAGLVRTGEYALSVDWAQRAHDLIRAQMGLAPHRF